MLSDVNDREGVGMKEVIGLCLLLLTVSCVMRAPTECLPVIEKPVAQGLTV